MRSSKFIAPLVGAALLGACSSGSGSGSSAIDAFFDGTPTTGNVPLVVQFTDQSTGNVTAWSWDFGDGGTSTMQNPSHTYTIPGSYSVSLTTMGPNGMDSEMMANYIVAQGPPTADFTGTPLSGAEPLTVTFTDTSVGLITSYAWDFGDGGASGVVNPTHTYAAAGTYTVALTVDGPSGADTETKVDYVVVNVAPPSPDFSANPTTGSAPLTVDFTDLTTGMVTAWSWDFGDSSGATTQNTSHTYVDAGTYTVALTATGPGGSDTNTMVDLIVVVPPPPVADFFAAPSAGTSPLLVRFTDTSIGAVDTWFWDFGDSIASTIQNPIHTYQVPGAYTVTLTASGPGGSDMITKVDHIVVDGPLAISDVSPDTVDSLVPGTGETVTLIGYGFSQVTEVEVDGIVLASEDYTVVNDTAITLDMPQVDRLGQVLITVTTPAQSASNAIEVVVPRAARLQVGTGDPGNELTVANGGRVLLAGAPGTSHFVLLSPSNIPSVAPLIALDLGNGFTELFDSGIFLTIPDESWVELSGPFTINMQATIYFQSVVFGTAQRPFPVSNLQEALFTP